MNYDTKSMNKVFLPFHSEPKTSETSNEQPLQKNFVDFLEALILPAVCSKCYYFAGFSAWFLLPLQKTQKPKTQTPNDFMFKITEVESDNITDNPSAAPY